MQLSRFGRKFGGRTGIMDLMDDMGRALAGTEKKYMLGGGNPAIIPEITEVWRRRMAEICAAPDGLQRLVGNYDTPQGQPAFLEALAALLRREYGWELTSRNIAITNGSQAGFFILLNMLSGPERILFPLLPEYVGYADQGVEEGTFVACRPLIERLDEHTHKYRVDFDAVTRVLEEARRGEGAPIGAICVSRPTNPSGNVLTDGELHRLDELARQYDVPLIVDNAYGLPFPGIVFEEELEGTARPLWNPNIILGMSLSKIGLPGARTGIIVADEAVIIALSRANAVINLANGMTGQQVVEPLLRDGTILNLAREIIRPFYRTRALAARTWLSDALKPQIPWSVHRLEGSIFLWLWLPELPIPTTELYERLKERNVIVVPGDYFFFGDPALAEWEHSRQCLRINYGQEPADVQHGIGVLADEINRISRG